MEELILENLFTHYIFRIAITEPLHICAGMVESTNILQNLISWDQEQYDTCIINFEIIV